MKKELNIILGIAVLLLFSVQNLFSQDIHFSQYYASPISLNPSYTGMYDSDWRAMANYRTQWRAIAEPYNTVSLGYDRQFYLYSQKFSGGIYFVNDESGGINLNVNKLYLSMAYHKEVNYHEFHVGVQLGWVFKSVDESKMTLPNQFDNTNGYFNSSLASKESSSFEGLNYPDLNIGLGWSKKMQNMESFAGLSLHHVLFPKETFTEYDNYLHMRIGLQGGLEYDMSDRVYIMPYASIQYHKRAKEFMLGSNIGYKLPLRPYKIKDIFTGIHFRNTIDLETDALVFVVGMHFENVYAGISYDINISNLHNATSNRGALEFAVIYTGLNTNMIKQTIPCDRY